MKEKIVTAIKAKFPKVNLSKKRLEAIATKIESKVIDDETKIDAAIDEFNYYNDLTEMAKQDDNVRSLESKLKDSTPKPPVKKDEPIEVDEDAPAWAKALIEQNKTMSASLAQMQGEKAANAIRGKVAEKLKDVPTSYWSKRAIPDNDEAIEAFVTDVTADYGQFKQEMTENGLTVLSTAKTAGGGTGGGAKNDVSAEIKGFVQKQQTIAAAEKK